MVRFINSVLDAWAARRAQRQALKRARVMAKFEELHQGMEANADRALLDEVCNRTAAVVRVIVPRVLKAYNIPETEHSAAVMHITKAWTAEIRTHSRMASDPRKALAWLESVDKAVFNDAVTKAAEQYIAAMHARRGLRARPTPGQTN